MNPDLLFSAKIVRLEVIEEEPQTRDCGKTAQPCTQKREKIGRNGKTKKISGYLSAFQRYS